MAKVWRNRIIERTQLYSNCPVKYKYDVLNLLRKDVANGVITAEEFFELTGEIY